MENLIQTNLLSILAIVIVVLGGLWYFVPILTGLPWIPSKFSRIRRALELAALKPGEVFYDLGAGDGRVIAIAASEFGAHAIGVELSPVHCLLALVRIYTKRLRGKASIRWGNLYKSNIGDADMVFVYLTRAHTIRVKKILESQLQRGARVVTLSSDIDGWEPSAMDSGSLIFLYIMPSVEGSIASYMAKRSGLQENSNSSPIGEIES